MPRAPLRQATGSLLCEVRVENMNSCITPGRVARQSQGWDCSQVKLLRPTGWQRPDHETCQAALIQDAPYHRLGNWKSCGSPVHQKDSSQRHGPLFSLPLRPKTRPEVVKAKMRPWL